MKDYLQPWRRLGEDWEHGWVELGNTATTSSLNMMETQRWNLAKDSFYSRVSIMQDSTSWFPVQRPEAHPVYGQSLLTVLTMPSPYLNFLKLNLGFFLTHWLCFNFFWCIFPPESPLQVGPLLLVFFPFLVPDLTCLVCSSVSRMFHVRPSLTYPKQN